MWELLDAVAKEVLCSRDDCEQQYRICDLQRLQRNALVRAFLIRSVRVGTRYQPGD